MHRLVSRLSLTPVVSQIGPCNSDRKQCGHKKALVIGGTKGIGSGIAKALHASGVCEQVDIVGRDSNAGQSMLAKLGPSAKFWKADLSTLHGCDELVGLLAEQKAEYDLLVLTVGVWPNFQEPLTSERFHKVFFLDVIARFRILYKMIQQGLLVKTKEGAPSLVVSVLASSQTPCVGDNVGQEERVKILQEKILKRFCADDYRESRNVPSTLQTAGFAHDTLLTTAASKYQDIQFVGTFPGLVATGVAQITVGQRLGGFLNFLGSWVPGGLIDTDTSGERHLCIIKEVTERGNVGERIGNLTFWDAALLRQHEVFDFHTTTVGCWFWEQLQSLTPE